MVGMIDSEWGLIIVAVVLLLLFGGSKLPQFARSLGSAKKEFEKGSREGADEEDTETKKS
jgi:sec-independent protein translocase protein TatA